MSYFVKLVNTPHRAHTLHTHRRHRRCAGWDVHRGWQRGLGLARRQGWYRGDRIGVPCWQARTPQVGGRALPLRAGAGRSSGGGLGRGVSMRRGLWGVRSSNLQHESGECVDGVKWGEDETLWKATS